MAFDIDSALRFLVDREGSDLHIKSSGRRSTSHRRFLAGSGPERDTAWAMSQANIWHLNISYIGSGEAGERANEIIITARKRGKPVYGEGPWWNIAYENVETREAALTALSIDLDEIDPGWRDVLEVR
jgi:hypothetical protein